MYRSEEAWLFIIKLEVCVSYVLERLIGIADKNVHAFLNF